jgi:hypothetical protein
MTMNSTATFAAVYATLRAAHDLGDHVLQTSDQALGKAATDGWGRAMAGHVGGYHAAQVAGLLAADRALGLSLRSSRVALALALSVGTHALLDRRWPVRRLLELTGSAGPWAEGTHVAAEPGSTAPVPLHGPYLADQALHHLVLWLVALVAASGARPVVVKDS